MAEELERRALDASPTGPFEAIGRARRAASGDEEVWRFAPEDARVALRLLELGASNLGGFVRGGVDDEGPWLVRRVPRRKADALERGERLDGGTVVALVRDLARALDACEKAALFPGPLRPSQIVLEPGPPWILAEGLVLARVGAIASGGEASTAPSPKWTPPEQAAGAPWDNAANRYVLGLVAYRLLAGDHPFRGRGLRHALAEQASSGAPPFDDEVARALRPGVQSFVLRLVDPDPARRPTSAASITKRAVELASDAPSPRPAAVRAVPKRAVARRAGAKHADDPRGDRSGPSALPRKEKKRAAPPASGTAPRVASRALVFRALPILAGAVAALLALLANEGTKPLAPAIHVAEARPLTTTDPATCASCHAREVSEWQRSVMAHAAKSPLYGALESAVEEEVGRDATCPNGAGVLRKEGADACRDGRSSIAITGAGGEHWCVNCHAMGENLAPTMPAWSAFSDARSREPVRDLLGASSMDGISCAGCHTTIGPVGAHGRSAGRYEGNATWTSVTTGLTFLSRPEDAEGRFGISNSGYLLDRASFLLRAPSTAGARVHAAPSSGTERYLGTSEFCGACHDVRLFGSDVLGVSDRGEHFKRLRNAYSEWRAWADDETRAGRQAATCQGCHMSLYPGVCVPGAARGEQDPLGGASCPSGTHFEARRAGERGDARATGERGAAVSHYFTSVDIPLTPSYPDAFVDDRSLDAFGLPVGLRGRRDMLLRKAFTFALGEARAVGGRLEIPVQIENTGAGHRVPAGFSQEREIWVELTVKDVRGNVVYEVGGIDRDDADLRDKIFTRVNTSDTLTDGRGRPLGVFGADVVDGPDVPAWSPEGGGFGAVSPARLRGVTRFRGRGLINLQNGFLRCVRCIGIVDGEGRCLAAPGQEGTRAARFDDGAYDPDTGECRSNLSNGFELFETYFPVGALDADRGTLKAPDAIIDTRSAPPNVPLVYTYTLDTNGRQGPFTVDARLRFRSFPPFLVKAFADYEARKAAEGLRPSGPQVTRDMLRRIEVVDLASAHARFGG